MVDDQAATIETADLMDDPVLAKGLSLVERVASYLAEKPGQTVEQLAAALDANPNSLAVTLSRAKRNGVRRFETINSKWEVIA